MFINEYVLDTTAFREVVATNKKKLTTKLIHLSLHINADFVFMGVLDAVQGSTLIALEREHEIENLAFSSVGSSFEHAIVKGTCIFPQGTSTLFPNDKVMKHCKAEGIIGVAIKNEQGDNIAVLIVVFCKPIPSCQQETFVVELLSDYISGFVQKYHLANHISSHTALLDEVEAMSNTGAWEYHVETEQVFWSDQVFKIYAFPKGERVTVDIALSYYAEHDRERAKHLFELAKEKGHAYCADFEFIDAQGNKKWVSTSGKAEYDENGNIIKVLGAFEDISDQKRLMILSEERAQQIENILNNINDAVITIDANGTIEHCNNVAIRIFGYPASELLGVNISHLMPEPYASQHDNYMSHFAKTGDARIIGIGRQLPAKRKNGETFQMELAITQSELNGQRQYIGVVRDISERLEAQDTIYNLAFTDNVTQLRNSQWFEKECKDLILKARLERHYIHILLLDVDNMGQLNKQVGFDNGDIALKAIAENLKRVLGQDYNLYKHNADEFIILSKKTFTKPHIYKFDSKLVESAVLNPHNFILTVGEGKKELTASLGSAIFDTSTQSFETMLDSLEHAVRKAKNNAPFGLHHMGEDGIDEYARYMTMQDLLKTVVDSGELSLVMQPQYTNEGKVNSFEALLRWHSRKLGWVNPADFIPLAEESGAIINIGDWVLLHACLAIQELMQKGLHTSISVNISAKQIIAPDFTAKLTRLVHKLNIPPKMLMLEITETAIIIDMAVVKTTMNELAKQGFNFSIDDFGTGYSNLAYLKELPIAEVKIDKYFIDDINANHLEKSYAIVDAIIEMARALGVKSVAEGVETDAQFSYLRSKGCALYQGYLFSKPIDMNDWRQLIKHELSTKRT
jgi:PAS domain S-box-containing protein/diguanylate cyclase (GGDEF)-like protein